MVLHFQVHKFYELDKLESNGQIIMENIRQEWLLESLCRSDEPVFFGGNSLETNSSALQLAEKLPFSLITIGQVPGAKSALIEHEPATETMFYPGRCTLLEKKTFCSPSVSTAFFHKLQKERKIWWRKFSALPGRFSTTEITTSQSGDSSVEITADFDWCKYTVEVINLKTSSNSLQVKEGRSVVSAHEVVTKLNLEPATAVYLCDAYDPINEEDSRDMMRLHRKLAPYKVTFVTSGTSANSSKELSDLALVLARKIRKLGISCLLLPEEGKKSMEFYFRRNDAMGIPYTIVLNEKTLQDGLLGLRSRDTTLKEQTHASIVVSYIDKIMKNY